MPKTFDKADALAAGIVSRLDGEIRLALPLGIGKANSIANALTRAALKDRSISLSIWTALTLERPRPDSELARRFLEPAGDRLFGNYPELLYARLLHDGELPPNIEVREFFLQAGQWLGNDAMQRNYVSVNYTHALGVLIEQRPNVLAQLLARDADGRFSLSCNTDITVDLLKWRGGDRDRFLFVGEVNSDLPFMPGSGECPAAEIDMLLDDPESDFELFSAVKRPVGVEEHAIGLHVSRLFVDGGTIQIGIGSIGDAVANALKLRHERNALYSKVLLDCPFPVPNGFDECGRFEEGLYCVSEMLVDGLLQLFEADIIRRTVDGAAIHAGFFVENRDFYRRLREMDPERRRQIAMMPVSFTNQLLGGEKEKRAARRNARFVNNAMKATLLGNVISDSAADGQVVSGVGGQFNFVSQAAELDGARAIMTVNATRTSGGETVSNIVWDHPHISVPRHYRDIVVTEYGIADLRGKTDEQCVKALISVAAKPFQENLADEARAAGKLDKAWQVPQAHRDNTPERLSDWLSAYRNKEEGPLPDFPFGSDFNAVEQRLLPALDRLSSARNAPLDLVSLAWKGLSGSSKSSPETGACLERMGLSKPSGLRERFYAALLAGALRRSARSAN